MEDPATPTPRLLLPPPGANLSPMNSGTKTEQINDTKALRALLIWYQEMGISDVVGDTPSNMSQWRGKPPQKAPRQPAKPTQAAQSSPLAPKPQTAPQPADEAYAAAQKIAASANSIAELREAIAGFDGCALKQQARNTVTDDGIEQAPLMILGEAPGRDEDRIGKPFVGRAGQLLDRMLAAIGYSRRAEDGMGDVFITNMVYWRPPGNRSPTGSELIICRPFVERMIELNAPKIILLAGNTPAQGLHEGLPGITRARGQWREFTTQNGHSFATLPIFHPAYLLRSPGQKRLAWADLVEARKKLDAA